MCSFSPVVVGDGAVGTTVAVALSSRFPDVILAGPPGISDRLQKFAVHGYLGMSAEIRTTSIDKLRGKAPVVAALKAFHIRDASTHIERISNGSIICLSNGMGLNREWGKLASCVEYSVLTMGFRKTALNRVQTTPGVLHCKAGGRCEDIFNLSGIPVRPVTDMETLRWAKWFANSIINPLGALTGLANNELAAGLRPVINTLAQELTGMMPSVKSITEGRKLLEWLLENSSNHCSMLQDSLNGNTTEIDFLTGLCAEKKELWNLCPTASLLVSLVKAYVKT